MTPVKPWQVWWADLGEPMGHEQGFRRPAVVAGSTLHNAMRNGLVMMVPTTTRERPGLRHRVLLTPGESGLREASWAQPENLRSLSTERLLGDRPIGSVTAAEARAVAHWVARMLAEAD